MRVLHLHGCDDGPVEVHPRTTVVTGLGADARVTFIDALARLVGTDPIPTSGLVEVGGVHLDLNESTRELLALHEYGDVGLVVRAEDLPGHDVELIAARGAKVEASSRRDAAAARLDHDRTALASALSRRDAIQAELADIERGEGAARDLVAAAGAERSRLEFELEVARDQRAGLESALSESVLARDALRNEHDKVRTRIFAARAWRQRANEAVAVVLAALGELEADPPPPGDIEEQLVVARRRLSEAEVAAKALDPAGDESALARQLTAMQRRRTELVKRSAALGEPDVRPAVADALEVVVGDPGGGRPIVQALALADTWRDLHQQIGALDAGLTDEEREAEERVRQATRTVQEAEAKANQPSLTSEQIARVEEVHLAVLAAQDRTEGRLRRKRSARRLEQARADEKHVLARLGFATYADYMMSTSNRSIGGARHVAAARNQLTAAREALDEIPGASDRGRRRAELLQRKQEVAPKIAALLNYEPTGPESEDELRNLREEVEARPEDLQALAEALRAAELVVDGPPFERDDLVLLARSFLAEDQAVADERREAVDAVEALDLAIADLRVKRGLGRTDQLHLLTLPPMARVELDATTDAARAWDDVEAGRAAVRAAEEAVARRRAYDSERVELDAALAAAAVEEDEAALALTTAELDLDPANVDRLTSAADLVELAEAALERGRQVELDVSRRITERSRDRAVHDLAGAVADRLLEADDVLSAAAAEEQSAAAELARAEAALDGYSRIVAEREALAASIDRASLVNDIDWALLSRLADLRSVGLAGALPLVLDDPFGVLDDHEVVTVLDRLVRLAQASQIVVVSDRAAVRTWAESGSPGQAAIA